MIWPQPYEKPKRVRVVQEQRYDDDGFDYAVTFGIGTVARHIPTREAAEEIAAIYETGDAMSKHTPGPWYYTNEGINSMGIVEKDGTNIMHMATLRNSSASRHMEANARLIAAAPDLLEALRMVLDDPDALDGRPRTYQCVRAAIAKAGVEGMP